MKRRDTLKPAYQTLPRAVPTDDWRILVLTGLAALTPFILYFSYFSRLFWFGDEFDMIDQFDRIGFWNWLWIVFAENFVPVFKVFWGGSVLAFHGSYRAMLIIVWLTHALNVVLLGRLLRRCGLSWSAVLVAQALFGLAPTNVETLGWTVQWSAIVSVTFLLAALIRFVGSDASKLTVLWSAGSALAFSRGVLTGMVLMVASLLGRGEGKKRPLLQRCGWALAYAAPALAAAFLIAHLAAGNHQHMRGHWLEAVVFGTFYYTVNPVRLLFLVESWGWHTVVALGLLKVALVIWALVSSRGRLRLLFLVLVLLDGGNAVLLGIGRFQTGLGAAQSSRYQYAALLFWAPMFGYLLSTLLASARLPERVRMGLFAAGLAAACFLMCRAWGPTIDTFSRERGTDSRRHLLTDANPETYSVPGIPFMPIQRARELIVKYHLH